MRNAVEILLDVDDRLIEKAERDGYLRGLQAGRAEMQASVRAWMTATPFAICQMWGEYVTHMLAGTKPQ
jgi:hypothetical protein